jgi:hypothetical protein
MDGMGLELCIEDWRGLIGQTNMPRRGIERAWQGNGRGGAGYYSRVASTTASSAFFAT